MKFSKMLSMAIETVLSELERALEGEDIRLGPLARRVLSRFIGKKAMPNRSEFQTNEQWLAAWLEADKGESDRIERDLDRICDRFADRHGMRRGWQYRPGGDKEFDK